MPYKKEDLLVKKKICSMCCEEKSIQQFAPQYYKKTDSYYANGTKCSKCRYIHTRKLYADRHEDYTAKQRFREIHTVDGRAMMMRNRCKQRATRDGLEFNLSKQCIIDKLKKGKCEITGIPLYFGELCLHPYSPSVDRIDQRFGYLDDNIRVTCMIYNFCKNCFSDSQVIDFIYESYKNLNVKYWPDL